MAKELTKNKKTLIVISILIVVIIIVVATISIINIFNKKDESIENNVVNNVSNDIGNNVSVNSAKTNSGLEGTFSYNESVKYEFNSDGKGTMYDGDEKYEYTYTVNDQKLTIDFKEEMIFDATYTFKLDGDTLTLTGEEGTNGGEYTLKRDK